MSTSEQCSPLLHFKEQGEVSSELMFGSLELKQEEDDDEEQMESRL